MKRSARLLTGIVSLLVSSGAAAKDLPNYNAYSAAWPVSPTLSASVVSLGGYASSYDEKRGVPAFFWAPDAFRADDAAMARFSRSPERAARGYLARFAPLYGLSPAALSSAVVTHVHDLGRGAIIVTMRQELDGVELFRNDAKVIMRQDLGLVALSGSLHAAAAPGDKYGTRRFALPEPSALALALTDAFGAAIPASSIVDTREVIARHHRYELASGVKAHGEELRFRAPARVKKVFFPMPDRLVAGYLVEFAAGPANKTASTSYHYVISAVDGRVLYRENLIHNDTFNYRVWADATGDKRPFDGPIGDFTPHPTGTPDNTFPPFVAPNLVPMSGFNKNPAGMSDPWLPTGATQTQGNNVDAYTDIQAPDGFSQGDFRADVTSARTFDRTYDLTKDPLASQAQGKAAITDIFYVTNWLHDWWYNSGFDEAAGNAQKDNYGRGGIAGDPLHAEAEDDANNSSNNANMNPMSDGQSPIMQMYLWDGKSAATLFAQPLNKGFNTQIAAFGAQSVNLTASLVLGVDGKAPVNDVCEALTNDVKGKIVLIDRGLCAFGQKAATAQAAGAAGVIIANNVAGPPQPMPDTQPSSNVTIPSFSVSQADGATLKTALASGAVTITLKASAGARPDGTIDNTVVAHEWGHYIHLRQVACGSLACGAESEGWGDFNAAQMIIRPEDNLDGAFALAIYATVSLGDAGYFGIRRVPYSVDFTKNALTFKHISNGIALPTTTPMAAASPENAESHNAGEIWATMLFESYIALLKTSKGANPQHTFDEARRLMSDYVEGGLQGAPTDPTYTEQRDAILAAASANDPADFITLAGGFARRGAGSCAVSPPRDSQDLTGVVESFELKPAVNLVSVKVDDATKSCDSDGVLDPGEIGKVSVQIKNTGTAPLMATTATVASTAAGVTFPAGAKITFPVVQPFESATGVIDVALAGTVKGRTLIDLAVALDEPAACNPKQSSVVKVFANYDNTGNVSTTDTAESDLVVWKAASDGGPADIWSREAGTGLNHVWHGVAYSNVADSTLESPALNVGTAQNLVLSFKHRYSFEADPMDNWDGAVIEVSSDGGKTWVDISTVKDPGYTGTIGNQSSNPLSNRKGFTGKSPSYPAQVPVSVDLGKTFAGKTIKVRFRIGSDEAQGDFGWELDDIGFQGITNKPFAAVSDNAKSCMGLPTADAGPDQMVTSGDVVTLDASKSSDPDGDQLTFTWSQSAGPAVTLMSEGAKSTFTAPTVTAPATLTFKLSVSDGKGVASDTVNIVVSPLGSTGQGTSVGGTGGVGGAGGGSTSSGKPDPTVDKGCGCSTPGGEPTGKLAPLAALVALALVRRRRGSKRSSS
jgi:large repetitive protein